MDIVEVIFDKKSVNFNKLTEYGFKKEADQYLYRAVLSESGFVMSVAITLQGTVSAMVMDPEFNEPYTLHLAAEASGSFVGSIKTEYERILTDIAERCFEPDVFKSRQAKEIIAYVRSTYGNELEYLWKKFPDNAVVRRKDNRKWYAVLLTVSKRKLGMDSDELVEIIDLRIEPERLEALLNSAAFFPGYHMNKKHWYTIILDGSVLTKEIFERIDESYRLAE